MLEILKNIFEAFLIAFGQFNISILDSKDGLQIQISFISLMAYLTVFILFVAILIKLKNRYKRLYQAIKFSR